jgi:polyisoprenoid-binding protein YceI
MTNYFLSLPRALIATGTLCAAFPAAAQTAAAAPARYLQAASGGSLTFTFMQADAANSGSFTRFTTSMTYDDKNPAAGKLEVTVQIASLATQDQDRDDTLKSADLLDATRYPTAHYSASSFARSADGSLEAVGKLTLRGVTRDLRLPLQVRVTANGLEISGSTTIKRLEFGVGQGDWKSTKEVGDAVKLQFKVPLTRAG